MAQQIEITKFFHTKGKMSREASDESRKRISVRPLTELCKSPKKVGRRSPRKTKLTPAPCRSDAISLLSSDDDQENCTSTPEKEHLSSPATPQASSADSTPKKCAPTPLTGSGQSSPSKKKFFSPTRKRSIKRSPMKPGVSVSSITPKKLFSDDENAYTKTCMGHDDKTKFLLHIVHQYVKDESQTYLLGVPARRLLLRYLGLHTGAARLICRLYWRKQRWYRRTELLKIAGGNKDSDAGSDMFKELMQEGFLEEGSEENMDIEDYTDGLLKVDEFKNICKFLKIKSHLKKNSVDSLRSYCKSSSNITNYFSLQQRNGSNVNENKERVLKLLREAAGHCYRLSKHCRDVLYRLHLLSYLGMNPDILRSKKLELLLLNVKSKREAFPVDPEMEVDKPSLVFPTHESFESYMVAHYIYEDFLQTMDSDKKISIVKQAQNLYNDLRIEEFRPLAPWLRRFTPAYQYVRILEEGLTDLKKGKEEARCRLAVDVLSSLLAQDLFRQHRRAAWYDEKALLLHYYLQQPDQAATVLLEALSSAMSEEDKDLLRPRAKKLAGQKNIVLDAKLRSVLLAHGTKDYILESSLPSAHFYMRQMDNTTKGKVLFESKNEDGRTISSVEYAAISSYLETGRYTHGRHWEGRIVTTLFFLLFWDVIYSKPKDVKGIFLCHYQRFPLDMLCDTFYQSRKKAIDERLQWIASSSADEIVEMMSVTWCSRPEGEQGGIVRDLGWEALAQVARCLGAAPLAALCHRLAHHYKYAHSGFPDLTLWHPGTGEIKFAEVKSDSDKPSMKQIQWMQYLLTHGMDTEFCYVGSRGHHTAMRTSAIALLQEL